LLLYSADNVVPDFVCSFSFQHSLPRMIHEDGIGDPTDWLLDRPSLHPPEDNVLGSALTLCRLLGLYEGLMDHVDGDLPDRRLLGWLESEGEAWRQKWFGEHSHFVCLPLQSAFMLFCYHVFRFQLAEASLVLLARAGPTRAADGPSAVARRVMAFGVCTDRAMAVMNTFNTDLAQTLPMGQDAVYIGWSV
jgi:hypothetical protein